MENNEEEVDIYETFDDMDLNINLLRGIYSYGFESPSLVQKKGIKALIHGKDMIIQSQSGTGKTATFSIGILSKIKSDDNLEAFILSPTRELALQSYKVISSLSLYTKIKTCVCIGGVNIYNQISDIENKKPNIIVGTPGRILDLMQKKNIDISNITSLIIDEADEMLSRGFKDQIYSICKEMSEDLNISLFSATIPNEMLEYSIQFMRNPLKILIKKEELTLEGIKQYYIKLQSSNEKLDVLIDLYQYICVSQTIIYCNNKNTVIYLTNKLKENSFTVGSIHGDMTSQERLDIMTSFRNGETRILLSTDLLARGIDIQQISLVINYELPFSKENYIHRIGRSGRFGRKGTAINLISNFDISKLKDLEKFYATQIDPLPSNIKEIIN